MSKIFLSHSSKDKPFVRKLAADLMKYGHTVWIDEAEINIGDSLIKKIREGLDEVDFVAAVLSKASIESEWVNKELEIASNREIKEKRVVVLPLILEKIEMPGFLEGKLYGDFSNEEEYGQKLNLLLRSLGDSNKIFSHSTEELEQIKQELESAKELIKQQKKQFDRVIEYNLSTKSDRLKEKIIRENELTPEFAPINNVYAFELDGVPITIGYVLHSIRKSSYKGEHVLGWMLTIKDKEDYVERMIEAYLDMINSEA